jgi:hypothetical protein
MQAAAEPALAGAACNAGAAGSLWQQRTKRQRHRNRLCDCFSERNRFCNNAANQYNNPASHTDPTASFANKCTNNSSASNGYACAANRNQCADC